MSRPIIIFTICFNAEKTIRRTIESILANGTPGQDFTYIIQDGASRDSTLAIAREYESRGVIVRSEKDNGTYDAIDKAVESITDPRALIGFIHADDIITPGTIARMKALMDQNPVAEIVSIGCALENETGQILRTFTGNTLTLSVENCFDVSALPNARFISRQLYAKIGGNNWQRNGFSYFVSADLDFMIRTTVSRPVMVQDNTVGYIYLSHQGSTTLNGGQAIKEKAAIEQRVLLTDYLQTPLYQTFNFYEKLILRRQAILNGLRLMTIKKSYQPHQLLEGFQLCGLIWLPLALPMVGAFYLKKILRRFTAV